MNLNRASNVPPQQEAGGQGEIRFLGIRRFSVAEITAQLKTAVQMPVCHIGHRDLRGGNPSEAGEASSLDSNHLGARRVGFRGRDRLRYGKGHQKAQQGNDRLLHHVKV